MSRSIQKNKYHNYLTLANGCKMVVNGAKPLHHNNPQNILTDNMRQIWLTKELPAVCIVDMRNLVQRPVYFSRIGFICWHQYDSNPKLIQIQYTGQDNPESAVWVVLAKIRLELTSTWQHFKLPAITSKNISYLKIKIVQNHAEHNEHQDNQETSQSGAYLNQVSLGFVEEIIQSRVQLTANVNMREKTFSDYRKVNTGDKEVKRLGEKVKNLSNDNEVMRRTIDHQNSIIIKLQQAVQTLAENVGKLQIIQKTQEKKINNLQKYKHNHSHKQQSKNYKQETKKQKLQQFFNDESQIADNLQEKNQSRQKSRSQHNSVYEQHSSHLQRTNKQSVYNKSNKRKSGHKQVKSNQKSNHSKKKNVINANINESQESMSEYEGEVDQRVYRYGRKNVDETNSKDKKYMPMLQKLQELMMLRNEKKNKLKTHKKPQRSSNIVVSGSQSDQSDQTDQ